MSGHKIKIINNEALGLEVEVYKNLHNGLWSVRSKKTKRILGHAGTVLLDGVKFKVSESGRKRVIESGQKNVHAFVIGKLVAFDGLVSVVHLDFDDLHQVRYNPFLFWSFVKSKDETPIYSADGCLMVEGVVYLID